MDHLDGLQACPMYAQSDLDQENSVVTSTLLVLCHVPLVVTVRETTVVGVCWSSRVFGPDGLCQVANT